MEASHSPREPSSLAAQETHHDIQLDPAFVDRLKVAAATAIIKQKPASMSGKDYAKQLAERLRKKEDSWKAKANNLEMELLKTKQELLLAKTKTSLPHSINGKFVIHILVIFAFLLEKFFLCPAVNFINGYAVHQLFPQQICN